MTYMICGRVSGEPDVRRYYILPQGWFSAASPVVLRHQPERHQPMYGYAIRHVLIHQICQWFTDPTRAMIHCSRSFLICVSGFRPVVKAVSGH